MAYQTIDYPTDRLVHARCGGRVRRQVTKGRIRCDVNHWCDSDGARVDGTHVVDAGNIYDGYYATTVEPAGVMLSSVKPDETCAECDTSQDLHPARFYYTAGPEQRLCRGCMTEATRTPGFVAP